MRLGLGQGLVRSVSLFAFIESVLHIFEGNIGVHIRSCRSDIADYLKDLEEGLVERVTFTAKKKVTKPVAVKFYRISTKTLSPAQLDSVGGNNDSGEPFTNQTHQVTEVDYPASYATAIVIMYLERGICRQENRLI